MSNRLDIELVKRKMVQSRSQAESYIRLGLVKVDGQIITKPAKYVNDAMKLELMSDQYVSRAGLKLASVAQALDIDFKGKIVLDVGSSTGGFTEFALQQGSKKVIAVDVGTDQLHPSLRNNERIELHEKTDIRDFATQPMAQPPDIVLIDVSFISLREVLPAVTKLSTKNTQFIAMVKPQFEAGSDAKHKGVIKNERMRRQILSDFEKWVSNTFFIQSKADSAVIGEKGNRERFYLLKKL